MKLICKLLAAGMLLVSCLVVAGLEGEANLEIDFENKMASGLPITVRFSENPEETIGCGVRHSVGGEGLVSSAFCRATLSADPENRIVCSTFNPDLIDKIGDLNHYSFIRFSWEWNEEHEYDECIAIRFTTQSHHIPESLNPDPKDKKDDK